MHRHYRIYKIIRMKKELGEVYACQLIENLALFLIGIFIPAMLIELGFGFAEAVFFMLLQYFVYIPVTPLAARINSHIGVKHTILLRAPILIVYLSMLMNIGNYPLLYYPASILGGVSLTLFWTSMNTEYVRTSDKRREGEEAGLMFGLPYLAAVVGPVTGAIILTLFGFPVLFTISVILIILSVIPLFLSSDFKGEGFMTKNLDLLLDKKKIMWYMIYGSVLTADFILWGLVIFLRFGIISLGIAASLSGLGMIFFTLILGKRSNTIKGRRLAIRTGGFLSAMLWILRATAVAETEFMVLSLAGGFIIMTFAVPLFADFAHFAKNKGPSRSVVFRQLWLGVGHFLPVSVMLLLLPMVGMQNFITVSFLITAALSGLLIFFRE